MHINPVIAFSILASFTTSINAAPIPQLAGEGAACNSILSSTDNGVGYAVKNVEDGLAGLVSGAHARRQLAGEGAACDSILSSTDNGVGYGVKNVEDGIAGLVSGAKAAVPAAPKGRRQLDKIANGEQDLSNALGTGQATAEVTQLADNIDGATTSAAANLGADIGNAEEGTLEGLTSGIFNGGGSPKSGRQLDKIANGAQDLSEALGTGQYTEQLTELADNIDGASTSGAATLGADIGNAEESTLEGVTSGLFNGGSLGHGGSGSAPPPPPPPPPHKVRA